MPLDAKSLLLVALGIIAIFHLITLGSAIKRKQRDEAATGGIAPTPIGIATGFVTPAMFFVGALFAAMWTYCMITGSRIDHTDPDQHKEIE